MMLNSETNICMNVVISDDMPTEIGHLQCASEVGHPIASEDECVPFLEETLFLTHAHNLLEEKTVP